MTKETKKEIKMVEWYNNPNLITTLAISVLFLIIVLSQSFAIQSNLDTNAILRNLLNHNSLYLLGLVYFIPLKTLSGKKYFNFLNIFLIIVYSVFVVTGTFTIIQSFGIISLVTLSINIVLLVYMIHTLLQDTRIWEDFKLKSSPFNEISNNNYFYFILVLDIILLTVNFIYTSTIAGAIISFLSCTYTLILARYIYIYDNHVSYKEGK